MERKLDIHLQFELPDNYDIDIITDGLKDKKMWSRILNRPPLPLPRQRHIILRPGANIIASAHHICASRTSFLIPPAI